MKLFNNRWLTWGISLVLLAVVLFFAREHLGFVKQGAIELQHADWRWLLATVVFSAGSIFAMAEVMRLLFRAGGVPVTARQANALTLASNAWSTTLPGGPALSTILQVQIQRLWGASVIVISWFIVLSSALSTLWLILLVGSAVLFLGADTGSEFSVWSMVAIFLGMLALSWLVHWASHNPAQLQRLARWVVPKINRLWGKPSDRGLENVLAQIEKLQTVNLSFPRLLLVAAWSFANRFLDILALTCSIIAVAGVHSVSPAGIILAYTTAKILGSTQVTPGGIGPIEAGLTAALVAAGLTAVDAFGAAIVYRMISFLLVTVVGWIVYFATYGGHMRGKTA